LPSLNHRVEVVGGVLADECRDVVQEFFKARHRRAQYVGRGFSAVLFLPQQRRGSILAARTAGTRHAVNAATATSAVAPAITPWIVRVHAVEHR
jgi:hypothetical protein